jgi:hypothetical protein
MIGTVNAMSLVQRRPQIPGLRQLLLVLGVLVGVLLMHGVAADHDMAMVSATTVTDSHAGTANGHGAAGDMTIGNDHSMGSGSGSGVEIATAPMSSHLMIDMCVAILVGGLLLPILGALRLKKRNNNHRLPLASLSMVPRAAATRWLLTPSLTQLCVSRT